MNTEQRSKQAGTGHWLPPAALCRLDGSVTGALCGGAPPGRVTASCLASLVVGSALFGAAFGLWRSPGQALLSALRMPLLMLLVTGFTAVISTQLAQALGARLTLRQTLGSMLLAFAIASVVLAALAPVTAFYAWQAPPPGAPGDMAAYRGLLLLNTAAVGLAGVLGNLKLYRLLAAMLPSRALAARVLAAWIAVAGLTGFELSWVLSPFLSRPDMPVPLVNPIAFRVNVFEYLFLVATGRPLPDKAEYKPALGTSSRALSEAIAMQDCPSTKLATKLATKGNERFSHSAPSGCVAQEARLVLETNRRRNAHGT